jgi:hypothetical protein
MRRISPPGDLALPLVGIRNQSGPPCPFPESKTGHSLWRAFL